MMVENTFIINSTLDNTSGLLSKYVYDETETNLPIVVMIHGFNLSIDAITSEIMTRIANQGYFVLAVGMRGRKGATGRRDASIRELHDIYDAINHVKENFPVSDKVVVSGYSGGGGNALGFAVKFPFVANTIVNHFGMVDYGYDDVESWYVRNTQYQSGITNYVGYDRLPENMNYYRARNSYEALGNIKAKVYNFHDNGDGAVSPHLTRYLETGLNANEITHETKISTNQDAIRYLHNMGTSEITEPDWLPNAYTPKPTMSNTGTFRVNGYIVTDYFKVFLGNLDDHVADVAYNLVTNTFTITPLTGTMSIRILKDNRQQTVSISEKSTFEFNGGEIEPEPIGNPADIKKYFIKQNGVYVPVKERLLKTNGVWSKVR